MQYLGFNLTNSVFYQRELRAAVTHIINREALIASVYKGFAEAAYLPCAPASPLYDQELAQSYAYDEEAFAKSLRSAEIAEGYVATLIVCSADPARVELAHRVADAISNAGLKMEVKPLDMDTYRYRLNTGQYDMLSERQGCPETLILRSSSSPMETSASAASAAPVWSSSVMRRSKTPATATIFTGALWRTGISAPCSSSPMP